MRIGAISTKRDEAPGADSHDIRNFRRRGASNEVMNTIAASRKAEMGGEARGYHVVVTDACA